VRSEKISSDLALEIGQDLSPEEFLTITKHFFACLDQVAKSVLPVKQKIEWKVQVNKGSNILNAIASGVTQESIESVCDRMKFLLAESTGAKVNKSAIEHLDKLSNLTNKGTLLKFWIKGQPRNLKPRIKQKKQRTGYEDYGTVEGWLTSIQDYNKRGNQYHDKLKIQIDNDLLNQLIRCDLEEELLEDAMKYFRKRVEVYGLIRYQEDGTIISVKADQIEVFPDDSELPAPDEVRGILKNYS